MKITVLYRVNVSQITMPIENTSAFSEYLFNDKTLRKIDNPNPNRISNILLEVSQDFRRSVRRRATLFETISLIRYLVIQKHR